MGSASASRRPIQFVSVRDQLPSTTMSPSLQSGAAVQSPPRLSHMSHQSRCHGEFRPSIRMTRERAPRHCQITAARLLLTAFLSAESHWVGTRLTCEFIDSLRHRPPDFRLRDSFLLDAQLSIAAASEGLKFGRSKVGGRC